MKTWTVSQANASMADVIDAALREGPKRIKRRGTKAVVMISESDWNLLAAEFADFGEFVLNSPISADDLPARKSARIIDPDLT